MDMSLIKEMFGEGLKKSIPFLGWALLIFLLLFFFGFGFMHVKGSDLLRLIVQEIVDVISSEEDKVDMNWRCKDGLHITWKLKQHFGIES
jgi:hypothetical protein